MVKGPSQVRSHINWLEMQAVWISLQIFLPNLRETAVILQIENFTFVFYLQQQGDTRSYALNKLALKMMHVAVQ